MMKHKIRSLISLLLVFSMLLSLAPMTLAEEVAAAISAEPTTVESLPVAGESDAGGVVSAPAVETAPAVESVSESENFDAGDFTIAPAGAAEDAAAADIIDVPAVEDVPVVLPVGEGGERSETEEVESLTAAPIETAAAEEVPAELQASYSGTCGDNLMWELDTETGHLTISGTGAMKNWNLSSRAPWDRYCSNIKTVTIGNGVTAISDYAFSNCDSLTSVTIPDSVTSIGEQAFQGCSSLTSVTIGDSVTSIGSDAFYYCESLTNVTIPDSVTSIGERAFQGCSSLTSVTIGNSVTAISDYAFYFCTNLASVTIGNGVTSIGDDAFSSCYSLTSVIYRGTEEQWNAITIYSGNDALLNAKRQYHPEHISGSDAVIIPATCTETGSTAFTCTVCGTTIRESIPALGHTMQVSERVDPTWEVEGHERATCSRCGLTTNTVLPKLKLADLSNDGVINMKDVTLLRRYLAGGYSITLANVLVGDVNKDGMLDAKDITLLRRHIAGGYGVVIS